VIRESPNFHRERRSAGGNGSLSHRHKRLRNRKVVETAVQYALASPSTHIMYPNPNPTTRFLVFNVVLPPCRTCILLIVPVLLVVVSFSCYCWSVSVMSVESGSRNPHAVRKLLNLQLENTDSSCGQSGCIDSITILTHMCWHRVKNHTTDCVTHVCY
jgi:hypothetical protein